MTQHVPSALAAALLILTPLSACSGGDTGEAATPAKTERADGSIRLTLDEREMPDELPMPGKIDPPDARWVRDGSMAHYGEPGMVPLIDITCRNGAIHATRHVPSDKGAKAMFAFVGYRGILRLPVSNDGGEWTGSLAADDRRWIAITGGPFYATVAGGGKVISPSSSMLGDLVDGCRAAAKKAAAKPEPAT